VLLGDAVTHEPVSYEINLLPASEPDSTQKQTQKLVSSGTKIQSLGGDGGLDKKSLWDYLDQKGIKPVIKPDENALTDTDCLPRDQAVRERNDVGYKLWAKKHSYGHRWTATEGIFSAVKRVFGEQIKATSERGMEKEAACKIWAYQKLKRGRKSEKQKTPQTTTYLCNTAEFNSYQYNGIWKQRTKRGCSQDAEPEKGPRLPLKI